MDREAYLCCDLRDMPRAAAIASFLESVGVSAWYPAASQSVHRSADEMLKKSRLLVLLWSEQTRLSEVESIVRSALDQAKLFVPASLDGSRPRSSFGEELSDYAWHDIYESNRTQIEQLARVIVRKLSPKGESTSVENALHAVRVATNNAVAQKPLTARSVCKILLTAITHGAPIYDDGDKYACAKIYEMAAKALNGALFNNELAISERQKTIVDDIQRIVLGHGYANAANAESFAWDLRDAFDSLIEECFQTTAADAVESMEVRFTDIADPNIRDIRRLLLFAISQGALLFNEGCHKECGAIYLRAAITAVALAKRAQEQNSQNDPDTLQRVERCLTPILAEAETAGVAPDRRYHWTLEHRAEKLAWTLRGAFDGILKYDHSGDKVITASGITEKTVIASAVSTLPNPIFVCYARADNESSDPSRRWLNRLLQQLAPLIRQADMDVWSDEDLKTGENWHEEIQLRLACAQAAVLLVSPAFLASEYIANSELPVLLKKANEGGLTIVPILVSPSVYHKVRFHYPDPQAGPGVFKLSDIQSANPSSRTLEEMPIAEQNRLLVKVAEDLLEILQQNDR